MENQTNTNPVESAEQTEEAVHIPSLFDRMEEFKNNSNSLEYQAWIREVKRAYFFFKLSKFLVALGGFLGVVFLISSFEVPNWEMLIQTPLFKNADIETVSFAFRIFGCMVIIYLASLCTRPCNWMQQQIIGIPADKIDVKNYQYLFGNRIRIAAITSVVLGVLVLISCLTVGGLSLWGSVCLGLLVLNFVAMLATAFWTFRWVAVIIAVIVGLFLYKFWFLILLALM